MKKQYDLQPLNGTSGKIYIGIPRERLYIPYFVDNRDQIIAETQRVGRSAGYYQHEGHRVDRNRDWIGERFMDAPSKPEWLVMLDSDMEHPLDGPIRLTKWSKPIVGGLYFHRGKTHDPFVFMEAPDAKDKYGRMQKRWKPMRDLVYEFLMTHNVPDVDGAMSIDDCKMPPLVECDAVATGHLAIHRSVLETMEQPWFEYRPGGNSEDLVFCYEAKHDYGIQSYCDLSTISGHYVFQPIGQAQFRQMYLARGLNLSKFTGDEAVDMLVDFMGISKAAAQEKIEKGTAHMVGDYWHSKFDGKTPTAKQVTGFYKDEYTGRLYIIELMHWNSMPGFNDLQKLLVSAREKKVLDFGSGIGTTAIQLAIQHNTVTSVELNPLLRKFQEYRLEKTDDLITTEMGPLTIAGDNWTDEAEASYDVIVAYDVLEHLPQETLRDTIQHFARLLKPGGSLVYHNNFGQQDIYPMHYDHSEIWNDLLVESGFNLYSSVEAIRVAEDKK